MIPRWRRLVLVLCALAGLAASPAAATRTYTSDLTALDQAAKVAGLEALLEAHRPDPARTLAAEAAEPRPPASSNAGFTLFGPRPRAPLLTARAGGGYRLLATPCPSFRLCADAALPVPWRPPELPDPDRLAVPEPAANHRFFGIGFPQVALSANPLPQKSFRLFEPSARSNESARARWLDTRTGHWLSEDPLFDIDSPNLYAFAANNPVNYTDPLGLYIVGGQRELEAIQQVLLSLGEEDLAKSLRLVETEIPSRFRSLWDMLTFRKTETRIEFAPALDSGKHENSVVDLFRTAVETGVRIEFSVTDKPPHPSGAKTSAQENLIETFKPDRPDDQNKVAVEIHFETTRRTRVPGPGGKKIPVPDEATVVHEFGHAYYYYGLRGFVPVLGIGKDETNREAVERENQYRDSVGLPRRTAHH